jgi:small conductance mechanosensitive channel
MAPNDAFVFWTSWIVDNALSVLTALIVLIIGIWLSRFLSRQAATYLPRASRMDRTLAPLLSQLIHYGVLIITFIVVLSQFGVQTASILAVLGAAGIAVALALQGTLSNLAAGIMLIVLRPFNIGDGIDIEAGDRPLRGHPQDLRRRLHLCAEFQDLGRSRDQLEPLPAPHGRAQVRP